ncbi:MAG: hypothetical protein LUQ20_04135 [Candidatus Methanoperedens sp.]|nr:hypothetical protein [Candidatus Methanoperedens sp.]
MHGRQIVQIYMPKTRKGAYSVQQAIQMKVSTRTIEISELGNDAVTVDVVQRVGALNVVRSPRQRTMTYEEAQ